MGELNMFPGADLTTDRYSAFAAYLQKFANNTGDQMQLLETAGEEQATLRLKEYFRSNAVLLKAKARYKALHSREIFVPDDFQLYIAGEKSEILASEYVKGLTYCFNCLEDFVLTPVDLDRSRQIVMAGILIRNRSIRLLEEILDLVAINSELMMRKHKRSPLKLVINTG
jgi:hypothetical protein